jgi:putative ABC transport system permease protein
MLPALEIGPLMRTIRRRPGIWALMVLEVAVGVTTIGSLLISGAWYGEGGQQPAGFDESNLVLVTTYTPSPAGLGGAAAERAIRERERTDRRLVRSLPEVEAATYVTSTILEDRWTYPTLLSPAGGATRAPAPEAVAWLTYTDGDVARALGLRFIAGAMPAAVPAPDTDEDPALAERPSAAVITRCLAARLFGDPRAAVGARLTSSRIAGVPVTGVVEDVTMRMALMPDRKCTAFLVGGAPIDHEARLVVRARPGRRAALVGAVTAALAGAPADRLADVRPFDSSTGAHHRIGLGLLRMLGVFGAMVALIALLGALAATSFLVAQRTRQIGIRRALGATRSDIVSYFLVESAVAAAMGSVIGVVATVALFAVMRQVFPAIRFNLALMLLALATLWIGTIVATLIPALRAARVSPSVAGRSF